MLKQLPKKTIEVIQCDMTLRQGKEYTRLIEQYKARKEQLLREAQENAEKKAIGKAVHVGSSYLEVMDLVGEQSKKRKGEEGKAKVDSSSNVLMELRKAANHPLLRRVLYNDAKIMEMAKLIMKVRPGFIGWRAV